MDGRFQKVAMDAYEKLEKIGEGVSEAAREHPSLAICLESCLFCFKSTVHQNIILKTQAY